jgi:hypothetical protein
MFTEPLPNNDIHTDKQTDGRLFMKHTDEMNSGAMIYIPSFMKIGSGIQKLIGGRHRHTDSMVISYAYFPYFEKIKVCLCNHHAVENRCNAALL